MLVAIEVPWSIRPKCDFVMNLILKCSHLVRRWTVFHSPIWEYFLANCPTRILYFFSISYLSMHRDVYEVNPFFAILFYFDGDYFIGGKQNIRLLKLLQQFSQKNCFEGTILLALFSCKFLLSDKILLKWHNFSVGTEKKWYKSHLIILLSFLSVFFFSN
jgi:hypothetical protein